MEVTFQVELVWNREFHFVCNGQPHAKLDDAIAYAKALEAMGDGERVKKTRIVDSRGAVRWEHGRLVEAKS